MTSIEFLEQNVTLNISIYDWLLLIQQAKEMHKKEIVNTYIIADSESTQEDSEHNALKFYERTYENKASDDKTEFEKPFMDFAKQYFKHKKD
jgi:hypothetical protein